jgi:hypothetical protein
MNPTASKSAPSPNGFRLLSGHTPNKFGGGYHFITGRRTKFFEPFASARKRVKMVSKLPDNAAGVSGKAALARPHSKTCRHLGRVV